MKHLTLTLFLLIFNLFFSYSQKLVDIANASNIEPYISTSYHWGIGFSFFDFDEDGWDDLTFPANNDSIVFFKNVNGTLQQIGSMLYAEGETRSIIWVDYDNDNDLDLCLSYADYGVRLYQNDGSFNFTDVTASAGLVTGTTNSYGVSFADPDTDGDLDLYVCNYSNPPAINNYEQNLFYVNQGNGTFIEMGQSHDLDNGLQNTFMAVWYDYNEDDNLDLHVINDRFLYEDALFENDGTNNFTNVAISTGTVNDGHNPMGLSVADYNNDGYQDVFLSDFGNGNIVNGYPTNYKLMENQAGNHFMNVAPSKNVDTNFTAWGALWVDYDNDSFEDLYIPTARLSQSVSDPSIFYKNNGGTSFSLMNDSIVGDIVKSSYSAVKGDINNDGFYDIIILNESAFPTVLSNTGNSNNYIKITPKGSISNRMAIGAKVKIYTGDTTQYQIVTCGSGLCSQNSQHLIFGIHNRTIVDSVEVLFPSGVRMKEYNLAANDSYIIQENQAISIEVMPGVSQTTICQGDSIQLGPFNYSNVLWSTGSTASSIYVSSSDIYSFTASSIAGDTIYNSDQLEVIVEDTPNYMSFITDIECGQDGTGEANLFFVSPPASNFNISWENGDSGTAMDSVDAGTYSYTLESINGCVYTGNVYISETPSFDVQFMTYPVCNDSLGTIHLYTFGGTPPFEYVFNSNSVGTSIYDLPAGQHELTVTDANGCEVIVPFTIGDVSTTGLSDLASINCVVTSMNGFVSVHCDDENEFIENVSVQSLAGKTVLKMQDGELHSSNQWKSYLPLATGIYIVDIKLKGGQVVKRVFVN